MADVCVYDDNKISLSLIFSLQCPKTKKAFLSILIELSLLSDDLLFMIFNFAKLSTILSYDNLSPKFNKLFEQTYFHKFLEKKAQEETGLKAYNYTLNELTRLSRTDTINNICIYYDDILITNHDGKMYSVFVDGCDKCKFSQIRNLDNIISFCGDKNGILALDNKGNIFTMDLNLNPTINKIESLPDNLIIDKICGSLCSGIALIKTEGIIRFSKNFGGKIALDDFYFGSNHPIFDLKDITQIVRSDYHTLLLSAGGFVYSFGSDFVGELGRINVNNEYVPEIIPNLHNVIQIAVSNYHSLVLTKDGLVYSFGGYGRRQLGLDPIENAYIPTLIPELKGIIQISTGRFHTLALRQDGKVYGYGTNEVGQLGILEKQRVNTPTLIPGAVNIRKVWAEDNKSLLVTKNGDILQISDNKLILRGSIPNL